MSHFHFGRSKENNFYKLINDFISNLVRPYNMIRMLYILALY